MIVDGEGDGLYRDDYVITIEDHGAGQLTAFCPICRTQIFGRMSVMLDEDLVEHMNLLHHPRRDMGRG